MSIKNTHYVNLLLIPLASCSFTALAGHGDIEEMLVVDTRDSRRIDVSDTINITPDSASLVSKAPGADVNGNGPLTGIPQYRGMYGSRLSTEVNGMILSSGGPNWMDPPLSYAPAAQLESLEVYRGISPVSAGQETIGGAINAKTWSGDFTDSDEFTVSGRARAGTQSVNEASLTSAAIVAANRSHRLKISGLSEQADNAEFADGDILPSEYERQRYDIGYGFRANSHTIQLDFGRNETGETGTAALPMDILYIDSDLASLRYEWQQNDISINAKVYYSDIEHGMTNYHLRDAPMNSMWRKNIASGENIGFKLSAKQQDQNGSWQLGIDGHSENHNSDIDNPNAPAFFVTNFNNAQRDVLGVFTERTQKINSHWRAEFGLRYNRIEMDADEVNATPAVMGMAPAVALRDNFNNAERQQNDDNIDWVTKFYYQADKTTSYSIGLARKSRSASYQERYLWLPLEATAGLADGRTYTGNIDLDAEVAHEIELGIDYDSGAFSISPRIYYRDVSDYIQGTVSNDTPATMLVTMMNTTNGTSNASPLQFNNVNAEFYGFDMDWRYNINSSWSLSGLLNYVRAERKDIDDYLYRIAPANTTIALNYQASNWAITVESALYAEQDKVSAINSEQETSGYGLINANGYWQLNNQLRLGIGIDNLLDKNYQDHLSGYSRAANDDIQTGDRLPGYGRNVYARIDYQL